MGKFRDLTGMKFGRWLVIKRGENGSYGRTIYECRCACGNKKTVARSNLTAGKSLSCGCLQKEVARKCLLKHGHAVGGVATKTHVVWQGMRQRCNNPKRKDYKHYGGRGISVCERWDNFKNFLEDMGERPDGFEIDRIENDGNYEPGNCRWVTREVQLRNNSRVKLNILKVQVIKKLLIESSLTQKAIADIFNVSKGNISDIKSNRAWKNVQYKPV